MEDFNYIIDAKSKGNMARYINVSQKKKSLDTIDSSQNGGYRSSLSRVQHSCNPNLFVQNVFVDTHDLRFPWVAFFAKRYNLYCTHEWCSK